MFDTPLTHQRRWVVAVIVLVLLLVGVASCCLGLVVVRGRLLGRSPTAPVDGPPATASRPSVGVGVRHLDLIRTPARPLPTTLWYPAVSPSGEAAVADAPVASGRFPLVLFSHGLPSLPETYAGIATRLAAAGFVVAAPTYPHTNSDAFWPTMIDVPNQPADAFFVVDSVLGLDAQSGDAMAGHLDTTRYAVAGHSAGGFTTGGMLGTRHDARLSAAVIIAGGLLGSCVAPAAEVLFVHGDADQTISYRDGRAAYDRVPWSKAFLTVTGGDHKGYLTPGQPGFEPVSTTIVDFLRATLYRDGKARARMATDGSAAGVRFERSSG